MIVVLDASVALKWFFRLRNDEPDIERVLALLGELDSGRHQMVQPPHFLSEMAAVLARKRPAAAKRDMRDLQDMNWAIAESPNLYAKAIELSVRFEHHLFDTLYHAAALETPEAHLVTSDRAYYRKAKEAGQITLLSNFWSPR